MFESVAAQGYNATAFDIRIIHIPFLGSKAATPDCPTLFYAKGDLGGSALWVNHGADIDPLVVLHEIGHNLGLGHAAAMDVNDIKSGSPLAGGYGDSASAMGAGGQCFNFAMSAYLMPTTFAPTKISKDQMTPGQVVTYSFVHEWSAPKRMANGSEVAIQFDMASFNVSYEGRSTWLTYFSNLRGYVEPKYDRTAVIRHQQGPRADLTWNLLSISKGGAWTYPGTGLNIKVVNTAITNATIQLCLADDTNSCPFEDTTFPPSFNIRVPGLGSNGCLEACTACALPTTKYSTATRVVASSSCAAPTLANSWKMIKRLVTDGVAFVQFQNLGTGQCITIDNGTVATYWSTSTGYRVLATPCLTDAVPATSAALYAHPQLFRVNNDLYDGSYLNFMSTMQAPGLTTFTCLTTCTDGTNDACNSPTPSPGRGLMVAYCYQLNNQNFFNGVMRFTITEAGGLPLPPPSPAPPAPPRPPPAPTYPPPAPADTVASGLFMLRHQNYKPTGTGAYYNTIPCLAVCTPATCPGDVAVEYGTVHTYFDCPRFTAPAIEQVWRASAVRKADAANGGWRQFESVAQPGLCLSTNSTLTVASGIYRLVIAPCKTTSTTGWDPAQEAQLFGMRPANASNSAAGVLLYSAANSPSYFATKNCASACAFSLCINKLGSRSLPAVARYCIEADVANGDVSMPMQLTGVPDSWVSLPASSPPATPPPAQPQPPPLPLPPSPSPPAPPPSPSPPAASSSPPPQAAFVNGGSCPDPVAGVLAVHNDKRALHLNTGPLVWNSTLAASAQAWANNCSFAHSTYGENLYAESSGRSGEPCTIAPASWYAEIADWDFSTSSSIGGKVTGHFTQVVWKSTTQVGCGIKTCTTNSPFSGFPQWTIVVCQYYPYGNYVGQYATQVQPLKAMPPAPPPSPAPPPAPPGEGGSGSGTPSNPYVVPTSLPWTSSVLAFTDATPDILNMDCADNDGGLWDGDFGIMFRWTAPASGEVQLSTCGATEYDTTISVLTGPASAGGGLPAAPSCVKGGDEGCPEGPGPTLTKFNAVQGTTYWIAVSEFNFVNDATFQLTVSWTNPPKFPPPPPSQTSSPPPSPSPPSPSPPPSPQPPSPSPPPSPKPPSPSPPPSPKPPSPSPPPFPPSPSPPRPPPSPSPPLLPPPPGAKPPSPPQTVLGLSYTLLRGKFDGNFPNHQTIKVLERGTMTRLGGGYSCNPLLPATAIQTCLSNKYKTQFAVRATGYLRVLPADAKRNVQLLLKATGWARVTFGGTTMSISGAPSLLSQTRSVTLPAGDHPIVVEWMQVSGTAKLQVMMRTGAAIAWAPPRFVTG